MTDPVEELFERWGPGPVDGTHAQAAYTEMAPGFRRARRRRQTRLGAAAVIAVAAVCTPIVLQRIDSPDTALETATTPVDDPSDTGDLAASDDSLPPTTTTSRDNESSDDTSTSTTTAAPTTTAAETVEPTTTDAPTTSTEPSTTTEPADPRVDGDPDPITIRSSGGTIVASLTATGQIVLDDVAAAVGFTSKAETNGDEAEVTFVAAAENVDDVKVRLDVVDGVITWMIEAEGHESEDHAETDEHTEPEDHSESEDHESEDHESDD